MRLAVVAFAIVTCVSVAHAETEGPWADGVPEAQRAEATALLGEGNALFLERRYADALDKYRRALATWDHPAIRFNVVRCLIQLARSVEASDELERALAYGAAPLQAAVYEEALAYQKLLANQIGELVVDCVEPGIELTLDGKPLATCPASERRRVEPGPHQVVGAKPGFLTRSSDVLVLGGKRAQLTMSLVSLESAGTIAHRWPIRVPWIVLGGGVTIAGIGGLVQWKAVSDMATYERAVRRECRVTGCTADEVDGGLRTRAIRQNRIAIGLISAGAAVAIVGGTMLYLNRARTVYPTVEVTGSGGASLGLGGAF